MHWLQHCKSLLSAQCPPKMVQTQRGANSQGWNSTHHMKLPVSSCVHSKVLCNFKEPRRTASCYSQVLFFMYMNQHVSIEGCTSNCTTLFLLGFYRPFAILGRFSSAIFGNKLQSNKVFSGSRCIENSHGCLVTRSLGDTSHTIIPASWWWPCDCWVIGNHD